MNLKDYIRGQRHGKEANQLERKAMDDHFLHDAIDGYDSVEGHHISVIEDLEKRLLSPQKRINKRIWIWAAAAVVVLLIGIPLLLQIPDMQEELSVVSSDILQHEKETTAPSLQKDSVLIAEHPVPKKKEKIIAETTIPASVREKSPGGTVKPIKPNVETIERVVENIENIPATDLRLATVQEMTDETLIQIPQENIKGTLAGRVAGMAVTEQAQEKNIRIRGIPSSVTQPDKMFVSGRITDETGEPIIGATVMIENSNKGTITDTAGNFQLVVPKDDQGALIASYIGMRNSEIPLKENVGDIMMKADEMALNEVIVVGYGTRKRGLRTGSVSAVKDTTAFGEEEFRKYFTANYDKDICAEQNITIVVEFFIDPMGRPGHIDIKENPCPALESEIKRLLLGSPPWSKVNRKVTLQIELP